jgi:hypothetical protein
MALGSVALPCCLIIAILRPNKSLTATQVVQPSFKYVMPWSDDYAPPTLTLYQNLSNAILGFTGVPDARTAFFGQYNDGVKWTIESWGGGVSDAVEDGNGGYNVTLLVGPRFSLVPSEVGPTASLLVNYIEIFNVDANGVATYLYSLDPDGVSGGRFVESCP